MSKPDHSILNLAAALLMVAAPAAAATAANNERSAQKYAQERISIEHARIASPTQSPPRSLMSRAANGDVLADPPEAPLDGSLVKGELRQVGYLDGCDGQCGAVCDCPSCGVEPGCGIEIGSGIEAGCGIEVGCGIEPGCGYEVGCGIEPGCGYEVGCGIEPGCGYEVGCGIDDCSCDACCDEVDCVPLFLPLLRVNWCRFEFFAGVAGFTGPMNFADTGGNRRDGSGSFGFYEGFNEGRSLRRWFGWDMAAQFGVRATQSHLSGASFTEETRNQVFVTGGLFRRVDYGLQYGIVIDYLSDDWYFRGDLVQLRSELSWRTEGCHVCGFQYFVGLNENSSDTVVRDGAGGTINGLVNVEPTDQYRFFYRRLLNQSGQWDAFAGWTENSDGLLGASMNLPLRRNLVLSTGATYVIPNGTVATPDYEEEVWNIALGLIYRPGGPNGSGRYCRPLFDVADNGSFLVDRQ